MQDPSDSSAPARGSRVLSRCLAAALWTGVVSAGRPNLIAADPMHWLVPSRYQHANGTLFESGTPQDHESAVTRNAPRPVRDGQRLYQLHCSSCHGAVAGHGNAGVPSLRAAGGAVVDFYVSTGRMPAADVAAIHGAPPDPFAHSFAEGTQYYHGAPLFDAPQTAAIVAYVTSHSHSAIPIPDVRIDPALLQRGRRLFEGNCQACHGAAGQGATVGRQWTALPLNRANPTQIGEAIRIGPGVMPRFSPEQLPDVDVDAIATYVRYLATNPGTYGGTVMDYLGPISEGAVGAFIGVGFLFWVIYFTGTKSNGRRFNEIDEP